MAENFAKDGMRVLAMAYKEASNDLSELTLQHLEEDLIFAGMQGMIDPSWPEAIDAVKG
jgi:magnesium-transporting ATPase (P-type)